MYFRFHREGNGNYTRETVVLAGAQTFFSNACAGENHFAPRTEDVGAAIAGGADENWWFGGPSNVVDVRRLRRRIEERLRHADAWEIMALAVVLGVNAQA